MSVSKYYTFITTYILVPDQYSEFGSHIFFEMKFTLIASNILDTGIPYFTYICMNVSIVHMLFDTFGSAT